ncbi:MAG TPA: amino acid permease [Gemmatimonadetes bacterium]|nr:amino acid permease [Gemmatimonadota bacterium]
MNQNSEPGFARVLSVKDGLAVTVGMVIGAGILRAPGEIAGHLGDPWLILAVWVLGGLVAGLSTLLLAEMSAALPQAGGKYVYAREAWGPVMGFVAGWSELLVGRGFSGAAKAVVIAEYVRILTGGKGSIPVLAGAVVLAFFFIHTQGIKASTVFQNITTVIKVFVVLIIASAGIWAGDLLSIGQNNSVGLLNDGWVSGFSAAYLAVAFAYYGWEDVSKMAEEIKDPGRALPSILLKGVLAVAVLYLLINLSFLAVLTPSEMSGSELVAQDAISGVFGSAAGTVVVWASLLILISSLNVNFLGLPRVAYGLASHGLAPRAFSKIDDKGTPRNALYFIAIWIGVLAISGSFSEIIGLMMMIAIPIDMMVLLGFFRLRLKRPDLHRPFRVFGYPWIPMITILLYLAILVILVTTQTRTAMYGSLVIGGLIVAGLINRRRQRI